MCVCFHEKAIVAPPHGHDGRPLVSFVLGFSSVFIGPTIQGQCIDVRLLFWDVDRFTGVSILNPHKANRWEKLNRRSRRTLKPNVSIDEPVEPVGRCAHRQLRRTVTRPQFRPGKRLSAALPRQVCQWVSWSVKHLVPASDEPAVGRPRSFWCLHLVSSSRGSLSKELLIWPCRRKGGKKTEILGPETKRRAIDSADVVSWSDVVVILFLASLH